jgi:circadian clock protein KaiC
MPKKKNSVPAASSAANPGVRRIELLRSGIDGLDSVLNGGFPKGGISIIQGTPGAGKTILGNQLCFHHVSQGGRALYVTLLAENHARMLQHMGQLSFFDAGMIPERLYYISAFGVLEEQELKGLLDLLRREVQARDVSLLVLDGLVSVEETAASSREFKKFIHELQAQATLTDCTMFLLTGAPTKPISAEHTMVDGVLELRSELYGRRAERDLEVHKMRGIGVIRGRHSMRITNDGVEVYPRLEALLSVPSVRGQISGGSISTGLRELDEITGGGLPCCSTTLLVGAAGVGKTTLGLHFLSQCTPKAPGLLIGFYETPDALVLKAEQLKLPLRKLIDSGVVEVLWQPTTEGVIDQIGHRLLDALRRRHVKRLFIDGIGGFQRLAAESERLGPIFAAFNNEFCSRGVTTIYTAEADVGGGVDVSMPLAGLSLQGVSPVAQNILLMRYVELRSRIHRMISALKVRDHRIEPTMYVYTITGKGIRIDTDADRAEAILLEARGR